MDRETQNQRAAAAAARTEHVQSFNRKHSVSSTLLMVLKQVLATCCRQVYASLIYRTALPQEYPH